MNTLYNVRFNSVSLGLDRYLLINGSGDYTSMSTQLTGSTCYFQTYLFAVLCKVGLPSLSRKPRAIYEEVYANARAHTRASFPPTRR